MAIEIRLNVETLRSLAFGSIGAAYAGVGTAIEHSARIVLIQNFTDTDMMFSFDGVNDHFPIKASASIVLDLTANKTINTGFFIAEGSRLYVKQIDAPSSGSVYFTIFYGEKD